MKTILLFFLFNSILFSQTQIGIDIEGKTSNDFLGDSVSLSSNGNIVAVGSEQGYVRVYENLNNVWVQIGGDIVAGDSFGFSVSLSDNGSILAIGAPDNEAGKPAGFVRVYENLNNIWTQIGDDINGEASDDGFGFSISLSADGFVLAVGAPYNAGNGVDSGHVRVYENIAGVWTQIGDDIEGEAAGDCFDGMSVSLSGDGSLVAIGAPDNEDSGHVRVYKNMEGIWTQIGSDIDGELAGDSSGWNVSLSSDGSIVAVGAPHNDGNGLSSGHVRVYENIEGVWTQIGEDIDGEASEDLFGESVSISGDGAIVAIGATENDGNGDGAGHVRIFKNIAGAWSKIGDDIDGEAPGDFFGLSVSLLADGTKVAVSAPYNDGKGIDSGHVRVFDLSAVLSTEYFGQDYFSVFPNPLNTLLNIGLKENVRLKKVNVYDALGQFVSTFRESKIDMSYLPNGVYFIEVEIGSQVLVKRIIKE